MCYLIVQLLNVAKVHQQTFTFANGDSRIFKLTDSALLVEIFIQVKLFVNIIWFFLTFLLMGFFIILHFACLFNFLDVNLSFEIVSSFGHHHFDEFFVVDFSISIKVSKIEQLFNLFVI